MTHTQFIHDYNRGACIPRIEPAEALRFMFSHGVASHLRLTFFIWFLIWVLLVGLTIFFFSIPAIINGIVIGVFAYFLPYGMFRYAADYIISNALEDETFFTLTVDTKIIVVEQQPTVPSGSVGRDQNTLGHQP